MAEMERGRLRRIFGKVATVVAVAATMAFYALGFQIGHAYYQEWQQNKAEVTAEWSQPREHKDYTANLPWAEAGIALVGAYGVGAAAIAAGKRKDSYGGGGYSSGYSSSSSNDGFFWGYMWGSSGRSGGSSSSGSSKDNGGAAAAVVIIGAVALAAGASVVSYQAVKRNFFTGEKPLNDKYEWKRGSLEEISARHSKPITASQREPEQATKIVIKAPEPPAPETSEPSLGSRTKTFQL
jgi:hypothetical protein